MALMRSAEIPKDAVQMTEIEAAEYAWNTVTNWDSFAESWALRYAPTILGGLSAISGVLISQHFRRKLKLGTYGQISMLIPITMLPGAFSAVLHREAVGSNLLLLKETCPICTEVKSAGIQLGCGVVYPMVLAPWSAFMIANRYGTYRIPSLVENPKELFRLSVKLTKPFTGTLTFITAAHLILSSVLTYFEQKNNYAIRRKLLEIENNQLTNSNDENLD